MCRSKCKLQSFVVLAVLCCAWFAEAAVIRLKNGNSFEGQVVRLTDEEVTVEMPGLGNMTFTSKEIASIDGKPFQAIHAESESNAAQGYAEALTFVHDPSPEAKPIVVRAVKEGWIENHTEVLTLYLEQNGQALQLFEEAVQRPFCDFLYGQDPPRGSAAAATLPYNAAKIRWLAHAAVLKGRRLEQQGDEQGALETYLSVMRFGHHLGQQPHLTIIDKMLEAGIQGIAYDPLLGLIRHSSSLTENWQDVAGALQEMKDAQVGLERVFENEIAFQMDRMLEEAFTKNIEAGKMSDARAKELLKPIRTLQQEYYQLFEEAARRNRPGIVNRKFKVLRAEAKQYGTVGGALRVALAKLVGREDITGDAIAKVSMAIMLHGLELGITTFHLGRAKFNLLATAAALRAYEAAHDNPPATLKVLIPQYCSRLPEDPFNDFKPLRYLVEGTGWRLYSIGPDRKDQRGHTVLQLEGRLPEGDLVISVGALSN